MSLHRRLRRHASAVSCRRTRLPDITGDKPDRKTFKDYPLGDFHIDIAEVRTEQGKFYRLVPINRTSKFTLTELHEKATRQIASDFLRALIEAVLHKIHTVLTDNGTHFRTPKNICSAASDIRIAMDTGECLWAHTFEYACA